MPDTLTQIGVYTPDFNLATGQSLPCGAIYQSSGLATHIKKKHPGLVGDIQQIPNIIASPDYIGHNPKEPDSVEFVKKLGSNLLVCVKLDKGNSYLYVASMYDITESKLNKGIQSGRIKKV